jgi:5-methylcytosine-specific restriction endonuclease McrA
MTKHERALIWHKYDGHCAYCGTPIEFKAMQVDHKHPQHLRYWCRNEVMQAKYNLPPHVDHYTNLMPTCRRCNHYKRGERLETFRQTLLTLHKRLMNQYLDKVAVDYGIITLHTWDGVFYFERCHKWNAHGQSEK